MFWYISEILVVFGLYQVVVDFAGKELTSNDPSFWWFFGLIILLQVLNHLEGYFDAKNKAKS